MKKEVRKLFREAAYIFVKEVARGSGKELVYQARVKLKELGKAQKEKIKKKQEKAQ